MHPHDLGVRIPAEHSAQLGFGQGVVLLDAHEGDVGDFTLLDLAPQVVVDLAGVQQHPAHSAGIRHHGVVDDRLEPAAREVGDLARRAAQSQHGLWREDDQRAARAGVRLTAQQVKVRSGCRGPRDRHVVFGGHLQEPFDSSRRVVRPLALVAVRQQQHHA